LDDATSSVDPRVEARILTGLRAAALPSTVVVVAHRSATIQLADEIVYVEQGAVVDRGRHEDVVARCDGYRSLVTAYELRDDAKSEREDIDDDETDAGADGVASDTEVRR
jgi:ABC-type multidrug transport system fused ATPase/permease subunit